MAQIERRERGNSVRFRVRIRIHGVPEQTKSFKRLTDAKLWAQQIESAIRKGEFQNVVKEAKTHTVAEVIEKYRKEVLPNKAASTQRAESTHLKYWEARLGEYALSYIEPKLVAKEISELAMSGDTRFKSDSESEIRLEPKSKRTIKHYRDNLELLLNHARQWGWIGSNPLANLQRITKINNSRVRCLDDDERKKLLNACKASPNKQLYPVVVFALSTGARQGEILKLTLNDVKLSQNQAILRDTKNGETRTVPIVKHLKDVLKEHIEWVDAYYEKHAPQLKNRWLFPRSDCLTPLDVRSAWENAREVSGVTDFRFHDLRHSAASYLAMNGATLLEIAAVLGHKTLQMVKRYSHLSENHTAAIVTKMNKKIFK